MSQIAPKLSCKRKFVLIDNRMADCSNEDALKVSEDCQALVQTVSTGNDEAEARISANDSKESMSHSESQDKITTNVCTENYSSLISPDKCEDDLSPDQYLKLIVISNVGISPATKPSLSLPPEFFPQLTPNQLSSFTNDVMTIVRDNNVDALKAMYETAGEDFTLQCCNRFGESVIHTACRRGFTEMVKFLINDAKISVRCRDDCGRTPFHDAFWNPQPQFEIVSILLEQDPLLLFLTDKRGNTPFEYARRDHWDTWRRFLYEKRSLISVDIASIKKYLLQ
jgi:hypothetical protein